MQGIPRSSPPSRTALLITMSLVTALVTLDTTITGVILPSIGRSLHGTFGELEWVITGYMLPFAALLIPAGVWADRVGRKRAALVGIGVFIAGSILCGMANSAAFLTFARVVQGVGAALLPSASIAVIGHSFRGEERTRAFAVWGAVVGVATTVGPVVGGVIAWAIGWRWAFLINLPIGLLLIAGTLRFVEESRDPQAGRFDVGGLVTLTSALLLLVSALIALNAHGGDPSSILLRLAAAAGLFAIFGWIEAHVRQPMVELRLLGDSRLQSAIVAMWGYAATAQILIFYVPLYLQNAFGYSSLRTGLAMLPFAVPLFVVPRWISSLARNRPDGTLLTCGLALTAIGNATMAVFAPRFVFPLFAVGLTLAGCGAGLLNGETTKAFMKAIPPNRSGMASGLAATVRFTGLMVAVAVMGALLAHVSSAQLRQRVSAWPAGADAADFTKRVAAGDLPAAIATLPASTRADAGTAVRESVALGMVGVFGAQALLAAAAAFFTARVRRMTSKARDVAGDQVEATDSSGLELPTENGID